jgi:hypothetical protein
MMKAKFLCFFIIAGSIFGLTDFSINEVNKIKGIIEQMAQILEGNHKELLEMEDVLARTGTALRKARTKELMRRKLNLFRNRVKDLKKLRNGFVKSRQLKEYIIALDDRLKTMEDNVALIEDIHFPQILEQGNAEQDEIEYPTFINPGDPRYELDEEEGRLAQAISKTRNLMTLRESEKPANDNFEGFITEFDENLKAEQKPKREQVPALGKASIDQFYRQLEESQRKDPTFNWDENRNDKNFREFFNEVEQFQKKTMVNKRIVTGFPGIDEPKGSKSRKTYFDLIEKISLKQKDHSDKQVVMKSMGALPKFKGFQGYMNDIRMDEHQPVKKEFQSFLNELEPVRSEVIIKHQRGIVKPNNQRDLLLKKETIAWINTDEDFLTKLKARRIFDQTDEFYKAEQMLARRVRTKTKTRAFNAHGTFSDEGIDISQYVTRDENARAHTYEKVPESAGFFVQDSSVMARTNKPPKVKKPAPKDMVKYKLENDKSLIPVTIQLLDEEKVPFEDVELEFNLVLPDKDAPEVAGVIIEASKNDHPLSAKKSTDGKGEATIHLLMELFDRKIKIEKEIVQDADSLVCNVYVKPAE